MALPNRISLEFNHFGKPYSVALEAACGEESDFVMGAKAYKVLGEEEAIGLVHEIIPFINLKTVDSLETLTNRLRALEGRKLPGSVHRQLQSETEATEMTSLPMESWRQMAQKVPCDFEVTGGSQKTRQQVEMLLKVLYSKHFFQEGKEALSLVLDAFLPLATQGDLPIRIELRDDLDPMIAGRYVPIERAIYLNARVVELFNDRSDAEDLRSFFGTLVHEMTHAIHCERFASAVAQNLDEVSQELFQEELGCSREQLRDALHQSDATIPSGFLGFPLTLKDRMIRDYTSLKGMVYEGGNEAMFFAELLARIPEMYCKYAGKYSKEEIDDALREICPLAFDFFWDRFSQTMLSFQESIDMPMLSKAASRFVGQMYDHIDALEKSEQEILEKFRQICSPVEGEGGVSVRIYQPTDLHDAGALSAYDVAKCIEKGAHHRSLTPENELMLSSSLCQEFETLLVQGDDVSQQRLQQIRALLIDEMRKCIEKDAKIKKEERLPAIKGFGLLPYDESIAKEMLARLFASQWIQTLPTHVRYALQDFRRECLSYTPNQLSHFVVISDKDIPFGASGRAQDGMSKVLKNGSFYYEYMEQRPSWMKIKEVGISLPAIQRIGKLSGEEREEAIDQFWLDFAMRFAYQRAEETLGPNFASPRDGT